MAPATPPLLEVSDLAISFRVRRQRIIAVDGVSLSVARGEALGIVGESGSGKSVMAYGLVGLLARNGRIDRGRIRFQGRDLRADPRAMGAVRGRDISFIFQSPRAALNPIRAVGEQISDAIKAAGRASGSEARRRALDLLELVRIERASDRYRAYPHELSGGMCQRVLIAMALAAEPKLLIADEPTTGLDVTTQKVVMDTLYELGTTKGLATILITHDVGLAARYCRRIAVMCQGRIVEEGPTAAVLEKPADPYTQRLVAATPRVGRSLIELLAPSDRAAFQQQSDLPGEPSQAPTAAPLLEVQGLSKTFGFAHPSKGLAAQLRRWIGRPSQAAVQIQAVRDLTFTIRPGSRLGIVGESGSGKTTASRMIARLLDQTEGIIRFEGRDISAMGSAHFGKTPLRRRIQVVFQDPLGSLNPRFTAYQAIRNPLRRMEPALPRAEEDTRIRTSAIAAGLDPGLLGRYPHQLSGGQQARVGIARALVVRPDLLILDEPTSALDVSVQALVLNQLDIQRRKLGLTYILISHDLNVIRLMCDQVIVMQSGQVLEVGDVAAVFEAPQHPYTRELLDAVPHLPASFAAPAPS